MGTGVVSVLLFSMPYNGVWLYYLSLIVFCLNVFLFVTFTVITLLRYILYPTIWMTMLRHPTQSLFVGCFPIALCTIINMIVYTCVPAWGPWVIDLAWALWWFDAVVSVTTCYCLPFVMFVANTPKIALC